MLSHTHREPVRVRVEFLGKQNTHPRANLFALGRRSASDLLRMETMVCGKLKWELSTVTPFNFLHQYCADLSDARILPNGLADRILRVWH